MSETTAAEQAPAPAAAETAQAPVDTASPAGTLSNDELATHLQAVLALSEDHPAAGLLMEAVARLRAWGEPDAFENTKASMPIVVDPTANPKSEQAAQVGFLQGIEHAAAFLEAGASGWLRNGAQQIAALVRDSGKAAASAP
jgi:hypothetical protein